MKHLCNVLDYIKKNNFIDLKLIFTDRYYFFERSIERKKNTINSFHEPGLLFWTWMHHTIDLEICGTCMQHVIFSHIFVSQQGVVDEMK